MTQTDNFLADLGAQLRDARPPRRDLRGPIAVAAVVLLAIAALALVPRGGERPAAPAQSKPVVAVLESVEFPGVVGRTVHSLRRAGYTVLPTSNDRTQRAQLTTVYGNGPAAAALRRRLGAAKGRGLLHVPGADVVVVLGADGAFTPLAATLPRVRVVNRSGSVDWAHRVADELRARGTTVTEVVAAGRAFRTRVVPLGPDPAPAAEAAADIGQPGSVSPRGANPDGGAANAVVYLGSDLPGATLLESALPAPAGACQPSPDGHGPLYECRSGRQRWSVRVLDDCYDAVPLNRFAKERTGCGVRP